MSNNGKNESFIRWQGRQIEEFGKIINLLLGLTLATIGFVINNLTSENKFLKSFSEKTFILVGVCILLVTTFSLLLLILNRLLAIRLTTKVARQREKNQRQNIYSNRRCIKKMDKFSWVLFYLSVILFFLGQLFVIIGLFFFIYRT